MPELDLDELESQRLSAAEGDEQDLLSFYQDAYPQLLKEVQDTRRERDDQIQVTMDLRQEVTELTERLEKAKAL